jgi:hypothetical protein
VNTPESILIDVADVTQRSALDEAVDFFREALAAGPREVTDIKDEARQAGIAEQTLRRARERLGIKSKREGQPGSKQRFFWSFFGSEGKGQKEEHDVIRKMISLKLLTTVITSMMFRL